uniref:Uncharacterized protein n=1 Tax=viral metagenome TaxID=1070528 RepID=A0A6C0C4X5_9ZZZZ
MEKGFDPIGLEKVKVVDWLKQDEGNIAIYIDESIKNSERILLLNKSYFLNPSINDIYKICQIKKNALMVVNTYDEPSNWTNIGFYLDKYTMINNSDLIDKLKSDKRVFKLSKSEIVEEFISKELLELSQVKLSSIVWMKLKNKSQNPFADLVKNIPYNEEVYFDELLSNALICYSGSSYRCINGYLRSGYAFFSSDVFNRACLNNIYLNDKNKLIQLPDFNRYMWKYTKLKKNILEELTKHKKWDIKTQKEKSKLKKDVLRTELSEFVNDYIAKVQHANKNRCMANIRDKINKLDKCFLELAPRNHNIYEDIYYYRGMTQLYDGLENVNDSINISTYLSLSTNPNIPYCPDFWNSGTGCCYYRFKIDNGVPYINMINTTKNKHEDEILLPRNLKLTLKNISDKVRSNGTRHKLYDVFIETRSPLQFKIDTGCNKYGVVNIEDMPDIHLNKIKLTKSSTKEKSIKVVENLEKIQETDIMDNNYVKRIVNEALKLNKSVNYVQKNPKSVSSKAFVRYEKYKSAKKMSDILKLGGNKGDILNDFKKKYLKIQNIKSSELTKPVLTKKKLDIIKPNLIPKPIRLNDALENLITINGHGGFNPEKIIVPEWCQVMIPHVNGLETDYTTPDASKDKLYEEDLYENKYFNYKEGWRLYLPGDQINNLAVSIFHDASSCNQINEYHTLQKPLSNKCKSNTTFNKFCPLYCTKRKTVGEPGYDYIYYKGKRKLKIKACSGYFLKDLFENFKQSLSKIGDDHKKDILPKYNEPILLIPFTCNAKGGSKLNRFDNDNNKEHLTSIYHKLYDERYPASNKSVKKSIKKVKTIKNCNKYKKTKDPKCNDQSGCKWVVNKGCNNK